MPWIEEPAGATFCPRRERWTLGDRYCDHAASGWSWFCYDDGVYRGNVLGRDAVFIFLKTGKMDVDRPIGIHSTRTTEER